MAVKEELKVKRGCGFRKVGGLYLVGRPFGSTCDRLPFRLRPCPTCGHEHKFNRGFMQVTGMGIFRRSHNEDITASLRPGQGTLNCTCQHCPACFPSNVIAGIMWVGKKFYTPADFAQEARNFGVSKRIPYVPEWLKLGETWVFLAHPKASENWSETCPKGCPDCDGKILTLAPGIFLAFVPQRVEQIVTESEATPERVKELEEQGIEVCTVPDDDADHR